VTKKGVSKKKAVFLLLTLSFLVATRR